MANYKMPRWFPIAARLAFGSLLLLTSVYCLLAYLPDTYFAFIQAPFQPWLVGLIRLHAYLYCGTLAGLSIALVAEYRFGRARRMALEFIAFHAAVAIFFLARRPFSHLGNDSMSFLWSLAALFPLVWMGVLDHSAGWATRATEKPRQPRQLPLGVAILAALGIGVLYPASALLRYAVAGRSASVTSAGFLAWGCALLVQVLFTIFAVCLFNLAGVIASRNHENRLGGFLLSNSLASAAVALVFSRVLLPSIPFQGIEAEVYSGSIAVALVLFFGNLKCRVSGFAHPQVRQPQSWRNAPPTQNALVVLVLLGAIFTVPALIGALDWNSLLAKLWATTLWLLAMTAAMRMWRPRNQAGYRVLLLLIVGSFATYRFLQANSAVQRGTEIAQALVQHTDLDAPYTVVQELWAGSEEKSCDSLCHFLREQTNVPASISVGPVDVKLVETLTPAPGPKPNIFFFVIDSLRSDYTSPYNPAVKFTPQIGEFAADSVVMRNAFTRYGGTTLSEPALWAGSMMMHKHYVQPFHPMNNLEKMLDVDGYDRFVSVDTVLRLLLTPSAQTHRLDSSMTNWSDQDLCSTVAEAEQKFDQRPDQTRPIFMYTQPQNIHMIALQRHASVRPPQDIYPGFLALAATEIKRVDGCFGDFVHYLKSRGWYDNSIIVLTADHGESYGESGHKNHAFSLNPSTVRVPLIIHVPKAMQKSYYYDSEAIAFNIDVTPTLYYLLGHRPVVNDPKFGRPLFTLTEEEHKAYQRDSYLVALSYGPVYGILGGKAESLFVADTMEAEYQYFDLVHDPEGKNNVVTDRLVADNQRLIRGYVQDMADFYHYRYHGPTLLSWMMH